MQDYGEYLKAIFFFGVVGAILLWIAKSKNYFRLPPARELKKPIRFRSVLVVFAIYLGMTILVAPLCVRAFSSLYGLFTPENPPLAALGWIQLSILGAIFLLFFLYAKAQEPQLFKQIWKDRSIPHPKPILTDILIGVMTWSFSFPVVVVVGQLVDLLLYFFFHFQSYEQVAVRYLREALSSPPLLAVALFTILFAAPIIEEFLFRGCLQTFLKRYMIPQKAIVLSSLCFAFFHYASSQGIGNISLVVSLFSFALFLGFVYERQASLFASIGLHMTFNAVSTLRILFFPD